jgi:hypothetical protein
MRNFTSNLIILSAQAVNKTITGTAIDGDILVNFMVANNEINQRLFLPEANLVVTGNLKLGKEPCTIDAWINSTIAAISLPAPTETKIEPVLEPLNPETSMPVTTLTPAQKRAATIAAKKAAAEAVLACKSAFELPVNIG